MKIRPVHPDDAAQLYAIVSHPSMARTLIHVPSMEFWETEEWMDRRLPGHHRLVAEAAGEAIASGTLFQHQNPRLAHSAGLGLMVHPQHWGQGVGSALMAALLDLADNWLNVKRVELNAFTDNPAAVHLYQKFDFQIEALRRMVIFGNGRWHDEYLMARLAEEPMELAEEVVPPRSVESKPPFAEGEITIRPLQREDAADLHALWTHPAVARSTLQLPSTEYAQVLEKVERRDEGSHRLVAVYQNQVIGSLHLRPSSNPRMAHSGRLGMMVRPEHWGRGVGGRLLGAALELADNWLNLNRVELEVFTDNPAAFRLYRKHGFVIEGTKRLHAYHGGRWANSQLMARLRD